MRDPALALAWAALLAAALTAAVAAHRAGLASTHVRDLVHVGAGVWVLGWPQWSGSGWRVALTLAALLAAAVIPRAARHAHAAARLRTALAQGDERWSGIVLYIAACAAMTTLGAAGEPVAAAGALLALALGDGLGGAVGRRFGRHHFRAPGGKRKSWEGTATVAALATFGVAVAAARFDAELALPVLAGAGVVAATAEAAAPRGTDNVFVPASVWLYLRLVG